MNPEAAFDLIRAKVCALYGVRPQLLASPRRHKPVVKARHMAAALAFDLIPQWTVRDIAFACGQTAHASVRYARRMVEADPTQRDLYEQLRAALIEDTGDPAE
jgi:chromosomal replication initiation ATPase DnaA